MAEAAGHKANEKMARCTARTPQKVGARLLKASPAQWDWFATWSSWVSYVWMLPSGVPLSGLGGCPRLLPASALFSLKGPESLHPDAGSAVQCSRQKEPSTELDKAAWRHFCQEAMPQQNAWVSSHGWACVSTEGE